ncbi:response regulator transcription factor [bacterium]|nr:response regulator transcription factor [bacterium]
MKISILLADDHKILRDGIRALLEKEPDFDVVGEADSGRTAIEMACKLKPDVIIMDIGMPDMNGIEATKEILSGVPSIRVLALSMYADKRFIVEMLDAGATGYLVKDCTLDEMLSAVRSVASNQKYIAQKLLVNFIDDYMKNTGNSDMLKTRLTPREREVLRLIAQGKNTKEISSALHISVKTVDTHRQHVMNKLNIHNPVDLTKYAIRTGLISI